MINTIFLALKGFCMGIADIIPGISGGTIALMLGIYEQLIQSIRSFDLVFIKLIFQGKIKQAFDHVQWKFLITLLSGILTAILLLSKLISWLLQHHPIFIHSFFFGLILATIPIIAGIMKKWDLKKTVCLFISTILTFFLVGMSPISTSETWWFIFLSGALAICAMILPGISGSFILLLLGKYQFILNAIHQKDFGILIIFISGIIVGILSFVRILQFLLHRYHDITIAILTGFVIGSLNKIWPWKENNPFSHELHNVNILPIINTQLFMALGIMILGFLTALLLSNKLKK